jgi:NAD(P)-dependent dehydrogenase (short-subunit alcohol dehydrogenase family)
VVWNLLNDNIERNYPMSENPVALITGAYRGLGLETCRQLAQAGYRVILTARNDRAGRSAADELHAQGLDVAFYPLDVTRKEEIRSLADHISRTYGRLDVLVNNAGIFPDPPPDEKESSALLADPSNLLTGFETNTLGPFILCQVMIPLMGEEGRIVNVSSGMGQLSEMNGCCPAYRLSKTALNAVTRIFADELQGTGIKINSVCPGWVRTEMGGETAPLSVAEGAKGIVWAATLPDEGPSGGFFRQGEPIAW